MKKTKPNTHERLPKFQFKKDKEIDMKFKLPGSTRTSLVGIIILLMILTAGIILFLGVAVTIVGETSIILNLKRHLILGFPLN